MNSGSHEGSINALVNYLADVAAVDEYIWVEYQKKHPEEAGRLREIERFGPFPFTPIVAGSKVASDVIERIQGALVAMATDQDGQNFLQHFGLDGFVVKELTFYDPIRENIDYLERE